MAQLLREIPEFHATINLVPSLIVQLQKYEEGHEDTHLRVSRLPADGLSADDMHYLLDNFFMVHPDHNIRPFARYNELYEKRGLGVDPAGAGGEAVFQPRHRRSAMLVESGLDSSAGLRARSRLERAARTKGSIGPRNEKQLLLDKQLDLLRQVIPLHKELAESGQIELSTTPFYHPILPLLVGQTAGAASDARRELAEPSRRLSRRRRRAYSPGRRISHASFRPGTARDVAFGRFGRAGRSSRRSPPRASNGSPPTKKFSPARPTAGSRATAKVSCAIPRCFIGRGASKRKDVACRWCFAIMR